MPGSKIEYLTVFCGASTGLDVCYVEAARAFGSALAARGLGLVYGGGGSGMMGAVARAALDGGARVVGVIPRFLVAKERPIEGLTELHVVDTMHERKEKLCHLGDAFAALPGGVGTLEELFEALTWSQLGLHAKPIGVLRVGSFFDPLLALMDGAVDAGFLRPYDRPRLLAGGSADELLDVLRDAEVPPSTLTRVSAADA